MNYRNLHFSSLLVLIILLTSFSTFASNLEVHFIDVDQGDAILIQSSEADILIDGGDRWDWVEEKLISYLKEQDVDEVNAIVSTHPHSDHIGGLPAVIDSFEVGAVYDSGVVHTTEIYESYLSRILEEDIPFYTPRRGEILEIEDLEFQVLHPRDDVEKYSLNDASIVLRMEYKEVSFLFTGDAEEMAEGEMIASELELEADILKVGHHGSDTSSTPPFIDEVDPDKAIIMCGEDNQFAHPHGETIETLENREIDIYCTAWHGDIVITTDGTDFQIKTETIPEKNVYSDENNNDKININTASLTELQELPGIGPAIAESIIEFRDEKGSFERVEDIKKVSGIAQTRFDQIKDLITVGGK